MLHRLCVQVFRPEHQPFGIQQLVADDGEEEFFKSHAVVSEEAAGGEGECRQDADPPDLPAAFVAASFVSLASACGESSLTTLRLLSPQNLRILRGPQTLQGEIQPHRHHNGQQREQELPQGQAAK